MPMRWVTRDSLPPPLKALIRDPTNSSSCNQDSGPRTHDPGYRTQDTLRRKPQPRPSRKRGGGYT